MKPRIMVGRFGQSYGIKGWIKVHSQTSPPINILNYSPWMVQHQGEWLEITLSASNPQANHIVVKFNGCDNPETAKTFTGDLIAIHPTQLPKLPPNEYYWNDLIGLKVYNLDGVHLGIIDSMLETGSNDVLIVKGDRQRLLPYTEDVIKNVNLAENSVTVDWDPEF